MDIPDHFALFGLPERFGVDKQDLERRYLALSRELHPDRHAMGTPSERLVAAQRTTDLNLAYKVLRDDFARAEHILRRRGIETSEIESEDKRQTVDGGLLMEIMELREVLSEAKSARALPQVEAVRRDVQARTERAWVAIREQFDAIAEDDVASLSIVANQLTALRYYRRILEEVTTIEEEHES